MIALALLLAAAPAPSPGGAALREQLPNVLSAVKVGEWVTYRFDDGAGRAFFWRIAVVGEEADAQGRPAVWVELDVGLHHLMKAPLQQMKILASREGGFSKQGVTRLFSAFGTDRPREVDAADLPRLLAGDERAPQPGGKPARTDVTVKNGAPTRLMTLGGTVTASPVEVRIGTTVLKRFWLSDQIPITHLAKVDFVAVQHAMEVRDWGLDAKPEMAPPEPGAATIRIEGGR